VACMCAARQTWDIAISQTAYGRRTTTYELNHSAGYMSLQKEFLAAFLSLWNLKRNEYLTLSFHPFAKRVTNIVHVSFGLARR
jgi:hypothetical protein